MKWIRKLVGPVVGPGRRRLPPGSSRAQRGAFGERLAADYCRWTLGYRIVARNWRWKREEVDLICRDGATLVFIEVRARSAEARVPGVFTVGPAKKAVLLRAFRAYLNQLPQPPASFRFDIVDVALRDGAPAEVRHYANIPIFPKYFLPKHATP